MTDSPNFSIARGPSSRCVQPEAVYISEQLEVHPNTFVDGNVMPMSKGWIPKLERQVLWSAFVFSVSESPNICLPRTQVKKQINETVRTTTVKPFLAVLFLNISVSSKGKEKVLETFLQEAALFF